MSTLMTCGNSEGERRCDARCYDAKGGTCTCCCGGANHGVGLQQAQQNVNNYASHMVEKYCEEHPGVKPSDFVCEQTLF